MEATHRIKAFLKDQIETGKISRQDLLKLKPAHLTKTAALEDIDPKTIEETLHTIQCKVKPDLIHQDLKQMLEKQRSPLTEKIDAIMKGLD